MTRNSWIAAAAAVVALAFGAVAANYLGTQGQATLDAMETPEEDFTTERPPLPMEHVIARDIAAGDLLLASNAGSNTATDTPPISQGSITRPSSGGPSQVASTNSANQPGSNKPAAQSLGQQQPQQSPGTPAANALASQLTSRVRALLRDRGQASITFTISSADMSVRPSGLGRGLTADYVATVTSSRGERQFTGRHLAFSELSARNEATEKLAAEIADHLSR